MRHWPWTIQRGIAGRLEQAHARLKEARFRWRFRRGVLSATRSRLAATLPSVPDLEVAFEPRIMCTQDVILERDAGRLCIRMSDHNLSGEPRYAYRIGSYAYWLLRCGSEVRSMSVTLSDGDLPSEATFSPSSFLPDVTLLPDPHFFEMRGYRHERWVADNRDVAWDERSSDLVWRGATNSNGSFDVAAAAAKPQFASQRLLACLMLRGVAGTDVRFWHVGHRGLAPRALQELCGERIPQATWVGRKFALDIDGHTNAWDNLFARLLLGCCVLKIESREGYRQWYYNRLEPWVTHVPVKADLSDLLEKLDWVRSHDAECREIAARGREVARKLTFDAVTREAVALVSMNWQRQRHPTRTAV